MGLFNLFKSTTPPPLYLHGEPGAPDFFYSPLPSATHPSIHSGPGRRNAKLRAQEEAAALTLLARRQEQTNRYEREANARRERRERKARRWEEQMEEVGMGIGGGQQHHGGEERR